MSRRIDELDCPLTSATQLRWYCNKLRDLFKDLYVELEFAAQVLEQNLSTLQPVQGGWAARRIRARLVANCLRKAASSVKFGGAMSTRVWVMFTRYYVPGTDARKPTKQFDPRS